MGYGGSYGGGLDRQNTGNNLDKLQLLIAQGNTTDSLASIDPTLFVIAKTNVQLDSPVPNYVTGDWQADLAEFKAQYTGVEDLDCKFTVSGKMTSDSSSDSNHVTIRLRSSGSGVLTGTTKQYSAGRLTGASTTEIGFTAVGYDRMTNLDEMIFEVAKDFAGTLIVEELFMSIEPLW